ncbi:putative lipopolysaccharide heptosyltransferase III [Thermodesulfatator autotrophicus]|uniref:Lipopolysaccharide heptosyltransferase III n=1 Tax=Thermodesulfatator autotrophicus TaxID=1795632 RepID=A0A177E8D2_9BACT|nr:putative lipopolysaccharide heptosyltransferase III [Thermodesulfatator autotrophicus]OAG27680.1 hypothetical protein TH606_05645 [Thermodesulfatator autotrophicus]
MKILAIKFKQIGDVLLLEPSLRFIKETFPKAELTVLVNDFTAPVLRHAPYIDHLIAYDRSLKKLSLVRRIKGEWQFIKTWYKNKFDLVISYSAGDRSTFYSLLAKGKYKVGLKTNKDWKNRIFDSYYQIPDTHTVLQDLWLTNKAFRLNDIFNSNIKPNLYLTDEIKEKSFSILEGQGISKKDKVVCLHPVANWFLKCWRPDFNAKIIDFFLKEGIRVIITSGKQKREVDFVNEILTHVSNSKGLINLSGKISLELLGGILFHSDLFFGIDTAPMHMAAALDKPVIALFGPTGKHNWGPWENGLSHTDWSSPYKKRGTQKWGKHLVIQMDWDCIPCGGKKVLCKCDLKNPRCLTSLSPEKVINHLKNYLLEIL